MIRRTGGSNKTKREGVSNAKKYGYGGGVGPPDPLYSHLTLLVDKLWKILIGTREKGPSILVYRMYSRLQAARLWNVHYIFEEKLLKIHSPLLTVLKERGMRIYKSQKWYESTGLLSRMRRQGQLRIFRLVPS
jgi:hypothetical protein